MVALPSQYFVVDPPSGHIGHFRHRLDIVRQSGQHESAHLQFHEKTAHFENDWSALRHFGKAKTFWPELARFSIVLGQFSVAEFYFGNFTPFVKCFGCRAPNATARIGNE